MTVTITLPPLPAPVDELWNVLLDLGEHLRLPWALIGGQMVLLHELETTPPGRMIEVPAGTQALQRSETVTVRRGDREGQLPRPTLLGAIVGKAAATALPRPERHYRDLALLLSLVEDPFSAAEQLTTKDRQRLRRARDLLGEDHPAWALVPADVRPDGRIDLAVLIG